MVIISVMKNDNNCAECRQLALLVMGLKSRAISGISPLSDQTMVEKNNDCKVTRVEPKERKARYPKTVNGDENLHWKWYSFERDVASMCVRVPL